MCLPLLRQQSILGGPDTAPLFLCFLHLWVLGDNNLIVQVKFQGIFVFSPDIACSYG